ncbi:MAG: dTDP-4-dehydrorhamnose reductase [Terrisporobacter sp.]
MKVLVTGINGQLGHDVVKELSKRGHESIGVDRETMDLTIPSQIKECIKNTNPDAIIHCAAYTAVDAAEDNEDLCRQINALATSDIAKCAKELDIPMIYISTDYVFDGSKDGEYTEEDIPNPINIYGRTKYEGETYVQDLLEKFYIVRISWVFGENGNNFIDNMIRLSKDRETLNIIDDQVGSPTYTKDLSVLLVDMIECDKYGIYHVTNEGFCSWYEFANKIFEFKKVNIETIPITTAEYKTRATRPINSKMSKRKLEKNGFNKMEIWTDAIEDYLSNI